MQPIVDHVVHNCWYDTIDSLKQIDEKDWHKLNLPPRLLALLQRALSTTSTAPPQREERTRRGVFAENFDGLLVCSGDEGGERLELLRTVLGNLLNHPQDRKYRKLKKTEKVQRILLKNPTTAEILNLLGFVNERDFVVCETDVDAEFLQIILHKLPAFNPFASAFTAAPGAVTVPLEKAVREREREMHMTGEKRVQDRNEEPEKKKSARVLNVTESLGDFNAAVAAARTAEAVAEGGDEELILETWRSMQRQGEGSRTFASREKLEMLRRNNRKETETSSTCSLRIIFPDKKVLELMHYFKPSDTIGRVLDVLKTEFVRNNGELIFSLFLPPKRLTEMHMTCEQSGLVPSATLRFNVDHPRGYSGPYLREGL